MSRTIRYDIASGKVRIDPAKEIQIRCPGFPLSDFITFIKTINSFGKKIYTLRICEELAVVCMAPVGVWIFGGVFGMILWNWIIMLPITIGLVLLNILFVVVTLVILRTLRLKAKKSVQQYVDEKNRQFAKRMKIKVEFVDRWGVRTERTNGGRFRDVDDPTAVDYMEIHYY